MLRQPPRPSTKILGFIGPSGSGKTTAIASLIRHHVAAGRTVGAIKHTHHPINAERRGDTLRFEEAGADPVILAGEGCAAVFSGGAGAGDAQLIEFSAPAELVARFTTDVLLIEGFAGISLWPVITLGAGQWLTPRELLLLSDK